MTCQSIGTNKASLFLVRLLGSFGAVGVLCLCRAIPSQSEVGVLSRWRWASFVSPLAQSPSFLFILKKRPVICNNAQFMGALCGSYATKKKTNTAKQCAFVFLGKESKKIGREKRGIWFFKENVIFYSGHA
ncbi:hypothetical protein TW95_gp1030 [Pandoravirus inopinatum]|uniref:Uncharacterized protein n=1 Tax=Pandoravirus inopinatum TaxID=1605721 RepID=A0A0B5J2I5_9VIRU|nr:hypothetical protein TW95_gp1030 [Pandoravirus inopinatum]AJF97764.1 hypothetical protein [Pandoravirus inopinatum]